MTNYHQFAPDPETLSNRMLTYETTPAIVQPAGPADGSVQAPVELPTTLGGLTGLPDRIFVDAAYRVILGREPDPAGFEYYLGRLRAGVLGKIDIAGDLRYAPEGRERAVYLRGLAPRYALRRILRLPVVGWLCRWLLAAVQLPRLLQAAWGHRAQMEQIAVADDAQRARETAAAAAAAGQARVLSARLAMVESAWRELRGRARSLSRELVARTEAHAARLAAAELAFEARHQRLSDANARLMQQLRVVSMSLAASGPSAREGGIARASADQGTTPGSDSFYLEFEDRFRGTRDDIKRSQEVYLDYVNVAGAGTDAAPILDIGCGRGEWLELLREHGCIARGVDLNRAMIVENQQRALDVVEHDALAYLADLPEASVRMVTGFHIIEHMPFDLLVRLFDECRRVLQSGGCVVFETPNPENLIVGAYTFYFDPTHRHPLPPQMVEFLAQQRGFADVDILRLHPRPEQGADEALLNKWFRAPVDYAVVGWKDGKPAK